MTIIIDDKNKDKIKIGEGVTYYGCAIQRIRVGVICDSPSFVKKIHDNYLWCKFDDENVPEAINVLRTHLKTIDSPTDSINKKNSDLPEINKEMMCSHPSEHDIRHLSADQILLKFNVVNSFVMKYGNKVDYLYCRKCKADLGDVK